MNHHNIRVGVAVSRFNAEVTERLLEGALSELKLANISEADVEVLWVPGAIELPLMAQKMAKSGRFSAVICLGAVIRGETDHYDYVCMQVSYGCQRLALDYELPIIFGVLTTMNEQQAMDRVGGKEGHKGKEAALAALEMVTTLKSFA